MPQKKSQGAAKTAVKSAAKNSQPAKAAKAVKASKAAAKNMVLRWEDDPLTAASAKPIRVSPPNPARLKITMQGPAVASGIYKTGTANFRYWDGAASLRQSAKFWEDLLDSAGLGSVGWHTGATLPIYLDAGVDLNAYYDRQGLSFFHDTVSGIKVFSGESPDVVCHELGHAILDALRPQLWDAAFDEAAAFHESFGDMSAILSNLQLPSIRRAVLNETGGVFYRNSRVSRLAEQLGWAIRQHHPDAVDSDCLRNAVNSFFYRDPQTLPPSAPANFLSSEPHSFSRVFTAGFFEALSNMLVLQAQGNAPSEGDLQIVSTDMGRFLVGAVQTAPVVPEYYSQIAAHMIMTDQKSGGRYRDALKSAFVRRGILSLQAAAALTPNTLEAAPAQPAGIQTESTRRPRARGIMAENDANATGLALGGLALSGADFGLGGTTIHVHAQDNHRPKSFSVAGATPGMGTLTPPAQETAAKTFVTALMRRGQVDIENYGNPDTKTVHPNTRKTHGLVANEDGVTLVRQRVECGFGCGCQYR